MEGKNRNLKVSPSPALIFLLNNLPTLHRNLDEARNQFDSAPNGGRAGVVLSLQAVIDFLAFADPIREAGLLAPLISLHAAISSLENNNVVPLLAPNKRSGRGKSSPLYAAAQAALVHTVDLLHNRGLSLDEAYKRVSSVANQAKFSLAWGNYRAITPASMKKLRERAAIELNDGESLLGFALRDLRNEAVDEVWKASSNGKAISHALNTLTIVLRKFRAQDLR